MLIIAKMIPHSPVPRPTFFQLSGGKHKINWVSPMEVLIFSLSLAGLEASLASFLCIHG